MKKFTTITVDCPSALPPSFCVEAIKIMNAVFRLVFVFSIVATDKINQGIYVIDREAGYLYAVFNWTYHKGLTWEKTVTYIKFIDVKNAIGLRNVFILDFFKFQKKTAT